MSPISAHILSRNLRRGLCGGLFVLMSLAPVCAQQVTTYAVPSNAGGVAGGGATTITVGPDGALWFGGNNHIGRITTSGVVTQYSLPTSNIVVSGITPGPDGALWFTENNVNTLPNGLFTSQIGRITTSGAVTEYVVPTNSALPYAITTGPDGALWFTESAADQVGRITTSGVITEYKAPSNTGGLTSQIVTGPDGNLWFTNSETITKVTTQGVVTQYTPALGYLGLYSMAVGPDGNLYVCASSPQVNPPAFQFGQLATSGALTLSTLSSAAVTPYGMAAGPDGAMWVTDQSYFGFLSGQNKIGRITLDGTLTEYSLPSSVFFSAGRGQIITAGPDGAMWFAAVGYIGRITTGATAPTVTLIATPPSLTVTQVVNGPSITQSISLTSSSATTPANISSVTSGGNAGDSVIPATGPTPATIPVVFTPGTLAVQTYHDTISVTSNATNSPLQIPVTLNIVASIPDPTNDYYFSDLVFNGGFQTTLTYINYSPQTVTCITTFYSDAGTPLTVPFSQAGAVSTRTDVLAPGQSFQDPAPGVANTGLSLPSSEGWAQASCNGPIQASLLYRYYTSPTTISGELAVSPETAPATKFVTFAQTATGVAYANPSATAIAVATVKAFSSAGALLGTGTLTIPPLRHGSFNVAPFLGIGSFTGWLQITSTSAIISLSINAEQFPSLSSMPSGDLPASAGSGGPATDYYFSDLVFNGGFQTTLTYINYSTQSVTCTTTFYSDTGGPLTVPFSQAGSVSTRVDVLPPGQSFHDPAPGVPANGLSLPSSEGWAHASCTGPIQASLLYRYYTSPTVISGELAVNPETAPATKFVTFAQSATGVAYANPFATQSAVVTVTVVSSAGARLGTKNLTIPPLQHGSFNVAPFVGLNSFAGWIVITSTNPIISLSINAEAFPSLSSMPPGDLPASTVLVIQ